MRKLLCDGHVCYLCGLLNPQNVTGKQFRNMIEVHHIIEQNEGGTHEPINLVPCCSNCHSKIHMNLIHIDKWINFAYCYKLKWTDEDGEEKLGAAEPKYKKK